MFEDIIKPKTGTSRWYPQGCPKFDEYTNGICSLCTITEKCKCYQCPMMGIECKRCVDG